MSKEKSGASPWSKSAEPAVQGGAVAPATTEGSAGPTQPPVTPAPPAEPEKPSWLPPKLVKMRRDFPQIPNGPTTADVHPDEVANFAECDWVIVE